MYTVFDEEEGKYTQVEEPDPSLSYTYADYLKWKFHEQLELIRGKIFKTSPAPTPVHQRISSNLNGIFYNYLKKNKCQVFPAPFDVRLPVGNRKRDEEITTVVQPDLCIVCDESKIDNKGCIGAPDLVIEILSPGNSKKEVKLKYELYEEAGVKEYWIVYPAEESIIVFILNENQKYNGAKVYAGDDTVYCKTILGLIADLTGIFPK
jgi:Uma2 family endonuclease